MQFNKPMIELVFEIRRRVDSAMKPDIKLANPLMMQELASFYHRNTDTITRTLIRELFHLAGDEWREIIDNPASTGAKPAVKVYRGQTSLESQSAGHQSREIQSSKEETVPPKITAAPMEKKPDNRPVRIYRGRVVE